MNGTDEFGGIALDDFGGIPLDDEERDEFGGIPLPFEEEQKPSFPSLGPSTTLADVLAQPTPQLTPWEGGVVRSALPGSLQPEDLLPAVRKIGGEIVTGEQGQTHPDIIKDYEIPAVEIDQRGFQGPLGFMDRESAAQALQSLTEFEPGRLHSTDLAKAQEAPYFPAPEARISTPRMPVSGELSTTYGGPAKPLASYAETMQSVQEGTETPVMRFVAPRAQIAEPRVELPKIPIDKQAGFIEAGASELINQLEGIPEFATSDLGVLSMLSAKLSPRLTQLGFSADLTYTAWDQAKDMYKNWDKMSAADKGKSAADLLVTMVLAGATGLGAVKPSRSKVGLPLRDAKIEPIAEKPIAAAEAVREISPERAAEKPLPSASELIRANADQVKEMSKGTQGEALTEKLAREMTEEQLKESEPIISDYIQRQLDARTQLSEGKITPQEFINITMERGTKGKILSDVFARLNRPIPEAPAGSAAKLAAPETRTILDALAARAQEADTPNAKAVRLMLRRGFGLQSGGPIRVIHAPEGSALGTIWWDKNGKPIGIQINAAKISGSKQLQQVLLHEVGHWVDLTAPKPVVDAITKGMTAAEKKEIISDVKRLKYEHGQWKKEFRADAVRIMAAKWAERNPTWWQNIVANVSRIANETLGIKLSRLGAENAAARSIAIAIEAIKSKGKEYAHALEFSVKVPEAVAKDMPEVVRIRLLEQVQKEFRKGGFAEMKAEGEPQKPVETVPIGMGGARAGEPAPGTQIEQLTQSLRNVRESKLPLREQIKESFNVGERLATAKDAIGKALTGLKSAGDTIINKWRGVEKIDDVLRAKGDLSQAIEERGWRLRQWEKAAFKAIPNPRDQAAISKWVDAGGDTAALQQGLANAPAKFKRAYQDALNLSGDKLVAAQNIQNYFESRLQEAIDAGVLDHGIENYIHRMYESRPDLQQKALTYTQTGLLKTNPALAKRRVFQFDWEAEKEGYVPVQSFIRRITAYEAALSKAIAAREFIKKVSELEAPDGRPIVDIKGVGIPIMDPAGVYKEATLVKPKFNPAKNSEEFLPNGDKNPNYRGDYASRDYRALQRWKWVGSDSGGKPIFIQGDVGIHPDFVTRVDALLKPSQVRYGPLGKIGRPLLNIGSAVKQTMLDLSGFHPVQVTVHGMEHKVMPWNIIKDINLDSPDIQGLLKGGMTLGGEYHGSYREGLVGSSLTRHVPFLGPMMESYHQWLFQDYIPRLKATMALGALKRNRARFGGTMSDEAIFRKTAKQANAAFGELNYIMLERSKTAQDMSRLILLAPDFLEARARFAAQAFEKGGKTKVPLFGNEQRAALLLGALTMYVTARIANKILDDQYHFEPENLFNIVYKDHAYGLRTVQGDILHLLNDPLKFWMSRLNPVYGRTLLEGLTGRDYFGRKRSIAEQAWDAVSTMIPITLRSNRERQLWESLLNGFGATARRWSEVDSAFKLAKDWKDKNGIPERGEFIYDPNKDPLRVLKLALNHGDEVGAAQEIKKVIASKVYTQKRLNQYFKRYATMPFAGSKANDLKFMRSLNADQRKTVEAARQHKFEIFKLYRKSRSQMSAPGEPSETTTDEFGGIPLE